MISFDLLLALVLFATLSPYVLRRLAIRHMRLRNTRMALALARALYLYGYLFPRFRAQAAFILAKCYQDLDLYDRAEPYVEESYRFFQAHPEPRSDLQMARFPKIHQLFHHQKYAEACSIALEGLQDSELGPNIRVAYLTAASKCYFQMERFHEAEELINQFLAVTEHTKDAPVMRYWCFHTKSQCRFYLHDIENAISFANEARKLVSRKDLLRWIAVNAFLLGSLATGGHLSEAEALEKEMRDLLAKVDFPHRCLLFQGIALFSLLKGDIERARDFAERSLHLQAEPNHIANALLLQAGAFAAYGNFERTSSLCHQVLDSEAWQFYKRHANLLLRLLAEAEMEGSSAPISPSAWWYRCAPATDE